MQKALGDATGLTHRPQAQPVVGKPPMNDGVGGEGWADKNRTHKTGREIAMKKYLNLWVGRISLISTN